MKILIAIIAYNESKNILNCIEDLKSLNSGYDIVLIDNSSIDDTVEIAKSLDVISIAHPINSGSPYGTLSSYFMYGYRNKYDVVVQFDGDGQHIAQEIQKIVAPILTGEADYVIGSRFLGSTGFKSYFFRRIGIRIFSWIVSKIIGTKITDITSGFRSYGSKVIQQFGHAYQYEVHDTIELLLLSYFSGARIKEVSVSMRPRLFGESEYNVLAALSFPIKGFVNLIGTLMQKRNSLIGDYK